MHLVLVAKTCKNRDMSWRLIWASLCLRSSANHPSEEIKPCDAFSRKSISKLRLKPGRPGVDCGGCGILWGYQGNALRLLRILLESWSKPKQPTRDRTAKQTRSKTQSRQRWNKWKQPGWFKMLAYELCNFSAWRTRWQHPFQHWYIMSHGSRFTYSMPLRASHHFTS